MGRKFLQVILWPLNLLKILFIWLIWDLPKFILKWTLKIPLKILKWIIMPIIFVTVVIVLPILFFWIPGWFYAWF